jgi:nitrite reductase/ring-hydroxylating ferredoxin subunit
LAGNPMFNRPKICENGTVLNAEGENMDSMHFNTEENVEVPPPADAPIGNFRKVKIHPDHWYPVAWSRELKAGKTLAVHFAGDPIVLVRPKADAPNKAVFALENRCAHRQVPLDAGVVTGCAIRCHYHGWTYNSEGACTDVPYLGKGKLPNGVRSYPCREEAGLILIFPGDPALAAERFPALGGASDPAYKTRRFGREVACHYSFMRPCGGRAISAAAWARPGWKCNTPSPAPAARSLWAKPRSSAANAPRISTTRT